MKKGVLTLLVFFVGITLTQAQTISPANLIVTNDTGFCPPDTFNLVASGGGGCEYIVSSIPYNTYPTGGTSVTLWDDQVLGPFNIGFSFDFYCNTYTQFYICSNGWVGFTGGQTSTWVINPVPSVAFNVPKDNVMGPWRDWNPGSGSGPYVTYQVQGTAPFRRLVVTWTSVPMFSCTTTYGTFQVVLFETTNVIENNLTNVPVCPQWGGGDGVQSLHNLPGTVADIVAGRNDNSFTATNESWRFDVNTAIQWIYQGDTVGEGTTLAISPNSVYPTQCEYVYAIIDSVNGNVAIDSVLVSPFCMIPQFTVDNVKCNGDSTGSVFVEDTNSLATYPQTFYWIDDNDDTVQTSIKFSSFDTLANVPAGEYSITIKDASGCYISTGSATVGQPPLLTSNITNPTMVSCPGGLTCDASATANPAGGTPPYFYSWSSGEPFQTANTLCPDSNFVTVTDVYGCTSVASIVIDVPDTIETIGYGDTMICITNPASIIAASTGGTPPFSYVWTEGSLMGPVVSTSAITTVNPEVNTQYFVSSLDANGCPGDTSEVFIKVRPALSSEIMAEDTICPYDTIDITVTGFGGDSIYTYSWSTGTFGDVITVSPDLSAWYNVTVSDQCGTPSYYDSVYVQVGGYSAIEANINLEDDSICAGESVYLIANGTGGFKGPDEYRYEWSAASLDDKPIQFVSPTQTTTYTLTITDLCLSPEGVAEKTVFVGKPYTPPFVASPNQSCAGTEVMLSIAALQRGYDYTWDFGDGTILQNALTDSVFHNFDAPGCYDITLSTVTDFGCESKRTEACFVQILQAPTADFIHYPQSPNTLDPFVKFSDKSRNEESIMWFLDQDTLSTDSVFVHEFADTGFYEVSLVAISPDGCTDTMRVPLHHFAEQTLFIPSSFSPNGDGLNDVFKVSGEVISKDRFELSVFDRWGNTVFRSNNPDYGWDGKYVAGGGEYVPTGSYPYILQYVDRTGTVRKLRGHVIISSTGNRTGIR